MDKTVEYIPAVLLFDMIQRERRLQVESPAECLDSVDRTNRYLWLLSKHMHEKRN